MTITQTTTDEQSKLWNGTAGQAWVDGQPLLDQMLKPFEAMLLAAVPSDPGKRVLDVGCGTGSTTLAMAQSAARPRCTGIDISEPMLGVARARAARERVQIDFIHADAETYALAPGSFDVILSRFGVMFFNDPRNAFANLRRAAALLGKLRFVSWRSADENPFMTTAERAAAPLLPNLPPRRSDGPGQFAFADARHVEDILQASDWQDVTVQPVDVTCTFPAAQLSNYLTPLGPLGILLPQLDEALRLRIIETARAAFEPYVHGAEVRFNAACWLVDARAA
jgi:ubiquinone/menaquinone biosynthesis C-methylase UbiE